MYSAITNSHLLAPQGVPFGMTIPSGKHLHNYGKSPFSCENQLFLWQFSIAFRMFTGGYMYYVINMNQQLPFFSTTKGSFCNDLRWTLPSKSGHSRHSRHRWCLGKRWIQRLKDSRGTECATVRVCSKTILGIWRFPKKEISLNHPYMAWLISGQWLLIW